MFLLFIALLPVVVLMLLIRHMDRNEQEPLSLVLKAFAFGAIACIPAAIIEVILGAGSSPEEGTTAELVVSAFFKVSLVEEAAKLLAVYLAVWKRPEFNEENDGIVYVGAAALGFAALENVFYVFDSGLGTGIGRAVSAVPLHCFTGVIMGWFVGLARCADSESIRRVRIIQGFVLAVVIHGAYDALLFTGTDAAILIVPIVIALSVYGIRVMKRGRAASIARWRHPESGEIHGVPLTTEPPLHEEVPSPEPSPSAPAPTLPMWKKVIAWTLLIPSALIWQLIFIGLFVDSGGLEEAFHAILGATILTVIPVLIGVALLRSGAPKR